MDQADLNSVEYDFDSTTKQRFSAIPAGTYLCRVDEARPGVTRSGHTRWALKYVVHDGPEAGRLAAWDGLTFSPAAAARTRQVLAALGMPHNGKVKLEAQDLIGKLAVVTVEEGVWRNPTTGQTMQRTTIPYGGVRPVEARPGDGGDQSADEQAAEIPF